MPARLALGVGLLVTAGVYLLASPAPATRGGANGSAWPEGVRCLVQAYPGKLCGYRDGAVEWCDGTRMEWDDRRPKPDPEDRLAHADLEDQMAVRYPAGAEYPVPPPRDFEPGRVRNEAFFRKMYGETSKRVQEQLVDVHWSPSSEDRVVRVTRLNGVAAALQRVADRLDKLPPAQKRFVRDTAGTFNWRVIGGTNRLSMHSFGIAIDLGTAGSDYWKWAPGGADGRPVYRNRVPVDVVLCFEAEGFIWGGKWDHFDTMHFEYRPELLMAPCVERRPPAESAKSRGGSRALPGSPSREHLPHSIPPDTLRPPLRQAATP